MRQTQAKALSERKYIQWLTKKHQELKQRVAELESRAYRSVQEERAVQDLKKRKLATKDAIAEFERTLRV